MRKDKKTLDKDIQFRALYANQKGELIDHPHWGMLGQSGVEWLAPEEDEMIPLPKGASLVSVPQCFPVSVDNGLPRLINRKGYPQTHQAVAALLPQGFTRTLLPACVSPNKAKSIPLLGYAAVGFRENKIWTAAVQTDEHRKWHPVYYNTSGLLGRINKTLKRYPDNRIFQQLAKCSIQYGCFTAQNMFYGRWEGGIPTIRQCNAGCIGCISESHYQGNSPQQRLEFLPTIKEITEVGLEHLTHARDGIISFGQGCEGEPSLNADRLAPAITNIRHRCDQGTININTNAGYTKGIRQLCQAGLDAIRVTIFSCQPRNYNIYHRPRDYQLEDVENSIKEAKFKGVCVALNLLTLPGFTDREEEIDYLAGFVSRNGVDMIQLRNLNIEPELVFSQIPAGGKAIGITNFISLMAAEIPDVTIGSYTHPVN